MTWHLPTQIYTMPSVVDVTGESHPDYTSDHLVSQNDFMFPQSLDHQDPLAGRYNASSCSYLSSGPEVPEYCQQQYAATNSGQPHGYRENGFVWIGTNNYYPSSTYDQRFSDNSFHPQRQGLRRHGGDRIDKSNSRKRRAPTVAQRRAANIRERRRMYNLNEAFDSLRQRIPTFAYEKRLSRIETLRLAISYISFMARIVKGEDPSTLRVSTYESPSSSSASLAEGTPRRAQGISSLRRCGGDVYDQDEDIEEDDVDDGEEDDTSEVDDDVIDEDSQDIYQENIQLGPSSDSRSKT